MSTFLFNDFDPLTPTAWKQKIQFDLKGADYNETLLWKTNEGIVVKPFYTKEDRNHTKITLPQKGFAICQSVFVDDEIIANKIALDALKRGASSIQFKANQPFNYHSLLKDINLTSTLIYFDLHFLDSNFIAKLGEYCTTGHCYFQVDIIGHLAETGNWYTTLNSDIDQVKKVVYTHKNSISVNASLYQNAGATITQELAYALSHTNEYLEIFGDEIAPKIHYCFSVGSNYFFEIAKLRAFRLLHSSLTKHRKKPLKEIHIFSTPSLRNKTIYDYNVNMLRTTSECMSAILGGSNTISNVPYDTLYHKSNEFGERIARNQLLILQKEAYLQEAQSFANGSYYIEQLTKQLAEKALEIFQQIEKGGGFLNQLKAGSIQKKIHESSQKEQEQFDSNQRILVGTNKSPNKNDCMKDNLDIYPFLKKKVSKTLIEPILKVRLAEQLEKQRLKKELS